jgi:microcystin-dependent protein
MAELYSNGASALVVANVSPVATVIQVENGLGGAFPSPTGGDFARLVIERDDALFEVVYLTSKTADLLTVTRAQEGTTALAYTAGLARVECRVTKGMLEAMLQKSGGTMTGTLNLGGQALTNAAISGSSITGGRTIGTSIRASDDSTANQIVVPAGGGAPTVGGQAIWHAGTLSVASLFPVGMVMMWYGSQGTIPSGWALCNGSNGTPDLRDKFVIGAGNSYSLSATGGATSFTATSDDAGAHIHTASATALSEAQLPAHNHRIYAVENSSSSNADGWQLTSAMGIPGENVGGFAYRDANGAGTQLIEDTGSGATHTHTIDAAPDHSHITTASTMPPYYALFYIMKV